MKTHHFASATFAFTMLALGLSAQPSSPYLRPASRAPIWEDEAPPTSNQNQNQNRGRLQRAGRNAENFGMNRLVGRPVRSSKGEQLSTITDFLVDPQSGRVEFAILPSGGGPKGMTYRIIPISAFTSAGDDALTLRLDRAQWDRVGTMEEWQLKNQVTIDVDQQERLSRQLGLPLAEIYDGHGPAEFVRATALCGQTIRSGNGQVGRVDDVVVDVTRHEAAVVLKTDPAFAGDEQRYIVGFQQLGARDAGSGGWMSRLSRDDFAPAAAPRPDFDRAQEYNRPRDYAEAREPVDPRGEESQRGDRYVAPERPTETESAAMAVQQTIDRSWARGRVDVAVEGHRIILRGMLDSDQDRADIERAASDTARGVRIENQIAVQRR